MNLGIIARADKTGLGNQTRNLVRLLNPFRVMVIDSTPFNGNRQYFETYKNQNTMIVKGVPRSNEIMRFLRGIDAVLTCEVFYSNNFVNIADMKGVRTYNQYNYEFLDNLCNGRLPLPTKLLSPSKWMLEEMKNKFPDRVFYLPPPLFINDFEKNYHINIKRTGKPRFLHTIGRMAAHDRNGTLDLLQCLKYTKSDFELVLTVQSMPSDMKLYTDERVRVSVVNPVNESDLYEDFDALILPRKYAGLCLPMNEALVSGLPVIMTDISPNDKVLPREWLVKSEKTGSFKARTEIDIHSVNHRELAKKIDWLCQTNLSIEKENAYTIGKENYSSEVLLDKYKEVIT